MKFSKMGVAALLASCVVIAQAQAAVEVVVTPSSLNGWALYQTDSGGIINSGSGTGAAEFVGSTAPASPLPPGSVHLATGPNLGGESGQMRNSSWAGTRIDALTTLTYSTLVTVWNGQQAPYLTIWLDTDGNGTRDDRLWFEPAYSESDAGNGNPNPQADVTLGVWQTWNALTGMWYSDSQASDGPGSNAKTLATYLAAKPNAIIVNDAAQSIGGIRVASGFSAGDPPGNTFNAYVDNFTIGTAARGTTTYNFELQAQAAVPEPYTIAVWSVLGLCGSAIAWRSRRRANG